MIVNSKIDIWKSFYHVSKLSLQGRIVPGRLRSELRAWGVKRLCQMTVNETFCEEDNPFYQLPTGVNRNNPNYILRYRENYNFFSSNSCNFITATNRAKTDCPEGYVFCNKSSKPMLVERQMTFMDAVDHCQRLNTTICEQNIMHVGYRFIHKTYNKFLRFARKIWRCGCRIWKKKFDKIIIYHLDWFWTSRFYEFQVERFSVIWM